MSRYSGEELKPDGYARLGLSGLTCREGSGDKL